MTPEEMQCALHEALAAVLRQEDAMLGRWVLVAETIEDDGSRATWSAGPVGQMPWETLGLLDYGQTRERSA